MQAEVLGRVRQPFKVAISTHTNGEDGVPAHVALQVPCVEATSKGLDWFVCCNRSQRGCADTLLRVAPVSALVSFGSDTATLKGHRLSIGR